MNQYFRMNQYFLMLCSKYSLWILIRSRVEPDFLKRVWEFFLNKVEEALNRLSFDRLLDLELERFYVSRRFMLLRRRRPPLPEDFYL